MHKNIKLLLICSIFIHSGVNLFAPIYALYIKQIGGTIIETGAIIGVFFIIKSVLYFLIKKIKLSNKRFVTIGYFILSIGYFLYIFAFLPVHLYFIQFILAFGEVIINPSWSAIIAKYLEKGRESKIYSDFYGIRSFFEGLAAIAGGFFASAFGFNLMFLIMTFLALSSSVISFFLKD